MLITQEILDLYDTTVITALRELGELTPLVHCNHDQLRQFCTFILVTNITGSVFAITDSFRKLCRLSVFNTTEVGGVTGNPLTISFTYYPSIDKAEIRMINTVIMGGVHCRPHIRNTRVCIKDDVANKLESMKLLCTPI